MPTTENCVCDDHARRREIRACLPKGKTQKKKPYHNPKWLLNLLHARDTAITSTSRPTKYLLHYLRGIAPYKKKPLAPPRMTAGKLGDASSADVSIKRNGDVSIYNHAASYAPAKRFSRETHRPVDEVAAYPDAVVSAD